MLAELWSEEDEG
ncbi:hypothetical protein A2U01_0073076, partial [Trifolium medium]|nr:hypothetical protein [Trifolium medium]